jgi:hypothetical protein
LEVLSSAFYLVAEIFSKDLFSLLTESLLLGGNKPISFLGLAHHILPVQKNNIQIQKAWEEKYPELKHQIRQANFEGGLNSLILDQVFDLDFLELEKSSDDPIIPPDNTDTSTGTGDHIVLQDMREVSED